VTTSIRLDSTEAGALSPAVVAGPDASWKRKITLASIADGASSQNTQTLNIKVTSRGATGSATYRKVNTVASGSWNNGAAQALSLGDN
jgi:hypothetical protein